MSEAAFDLAILGSGPGGYVSAIRAAQGGLRVALIEEKDVGGVCLHTGCIPTKAMVASAALLRQARSSSRWGVSIAQAEAPLPAIVARRQKVVQQLAAGVKLLLSRNRVQVFAGRGTLVRPGEVEIRASGSDTASQRVMARSIIVATGSRPAGLANLQRDGRTVLDSDDVLGLGELPGALLIVGGGYIGCEFASLFAALGSRITLIEEMERLLPRMDAELGRALEQAFKRDGIELHLGTRVERVRRNGAVTLELSNGQAVTGSQVLIAVGRTPNVAGFGLEEMGVRSGDRGVEVNDHLETSVPGVYAIGDVTGKLPLAHTATAQGRVVVANLLAASPDHPRRRMDYAGVPACVFTFPEIASVGLSEEAAAGRGLSVRVGRFPFAAAGKALAEGDVEGWVKLIADARNGQLVGGHIVGAHAAELIVPVTLAVRLRATAEQVADTIFPHPTLSESILEAAESLFGQATHLYRRP